MDESMCRQILAEQPYQYRKYSKELCETWDAVQRALTVIDEFALISTRQIRDHFDYLIKNRKKNKNAEKKLSGVEINLTDLDKLLDEIIDDIEGCAARLEEKDDERRVEEERETQAALDVRNSAMESFAETRKRRSSTGSEGNEEASSSKAPRRTGKETIQFLSEQSEMKRKQH